MQLCVQASKFTPSPDQLEQLEWESKSCPVDKDELGAATWKFLHTMAAFYPDKPTQNEQKDMRDFFSIFSRLYPCPPCAEELRADLSSHPPQVGSADSLSLWLCQAHNRVNRRLGKEEFDCGKVFERWRDGWSDGSCDQ